MVLERKDCQMDWKDCDTVEVPTGDKVRILYLLCVQFYTHCARESGDRN